MTRSFFLLSLLALGICLDVAAQQPGDSCDNGNGRILTNGECYGKMDRLRMPSSN